MNKAAGGKIVRIRALIRTKVSISGEKRDEFCLKTFFRGFFPNFQSWKFTARILLLHPPPDLRGAGSIAPVSLPCNCYFSAR